MQEFSMTYFWQNASKKLEQNKMKNIFGGQSLDIYAKFQFNQHSVFVKKLMND
jgi:predicted membrane metal-binding protein